jgi:hypothetical protein
MHTATVELLKFSTQSYPEGDRLVGSWGYVPAEGGSAAVRTILPGGLGATPVGGTITGALRQFNLPTSRAPGDWPEPTVNGTVRY